MNRREFFKAVAAVGAVGAITAIPLVKSLRLLSAEEIAFALPPFPWVNRTIVLDAPVMLPDKAAIVGCRIILRNGAYIKVGEGYTICYNYFEGGGKINTILIND